MTATTTNARLVAQARKDLNNLRGFVRRTGLTGWVKDRNAAWRYECAVASVAAVEDALGVDAAAALSDRLTDLRREAMSCHLLTPGEVLAADRRTLR